MPSEIASLVLFVGGTASARSIRGLWGHCLLRFSSGIHFRLSGKHKRSCGPPSAGCGEPSGSAGLAALYGLSVSSCTIGEGSPLLALEVIPPGKPGNGLAGFFRRSRRPNLQPMLLRVTDESSKAARESLPVREARPIPKGLRFQRSAGQLSSRDFGGICPLT